MRILIGVDFSENSFSAFTYGIKLAKDLNADVTAVHMLPTNIVAVDMVTYVPTVPEKDLAKRKMFEFLKIEDVQNKHPDVNLKIEAFIGTSALSLSSYADENDYDLVILGARDKVNQIEKILLGTTSGNIIRNANVPVLVVHKDTEYHRIQNIAVGVGGNIDIESALDDIDSINNRLTAKLHFVHVLINNEDYDHDQMYDFFVKRYDKEKLILKDIKEEKLDMALADYCYSYNIDILALIHREEHFWTRFLHKSDSVMMARKLKIPVLIVQE